MTENTEFVQSLYGNADSGTVLVQMVDDHELAFIEKEIVHIEDLTGSKEQIVTAVSQLTAGREVVSVTYCDVAGRMSAKPFEGVNIVATRYSDGTVTTGKAVY